MKNVLNVWRRASAALIGLGALVAGAQAQETVFRDVESFENHVRSTCFVYNGNANPNAIVPPNDVEADLFARCGAALNAESGGFDQADIFNQLQGKQVQITQSQANASAALADTAVTSRMSVVGSQIRSQVAELESPEIVLLASNDPDSIDLSGSVRDGKLDLFITAGGAQTELDSNNSDLGYDQDGYWVAAGADYAFADNLIAGAALTYANTDADFVENGSGVSAGTAESSSISVAAYGVYSPAEKLELSGFAAFGQRDMDVDRRLLYTDRTGEVDRVISASPEASTVQASASVAYHIPLGSSVISPQGELNYYKTDTDGYTETGPGGVNLAVDDHDTTSLQARIGASWSMAVNQDWGVLLPYARATWVAELEDGERELTARYEASQATTNTSFTMRTSDIDDSFADVALGASVVLPNGVAGFAEYQTVLGMEDVTHNAFSVGLRFEM